MMLTSWGYTITGSDTLADLITVADFDTATASRYASDTRVAPAIAAASQAVRDYCGWHIAGSLPCKIEWTANARGIIRTGADLLIQLPARFVSGITSVTINGAATTNYHLDNNGHLTVYDVGHLSRKALIEVIYTAGLTDISAVKNLVVGMVTHSVARSYGVTSEAAGGVSITYNSSWTNGSFDTIIKNNAGVLVPYRLEGVF